MLNRRRFIKASIAGSALGLIAKVSLAKATTPSEVEGPFYPITPHKDKDFDLTQVKGRDGIAKGKMVFIKGRVVDQKGQPIEGVTVDIWQANAHGRYRHPHDSNPAPLDPNFQGWAIVQSGKEGGFNFKTVVPGAYPVNKDWMRPPHIHFKVSKRGYVELTTQMYFPDHELNDMDWLIKEKPASDQALMVAKKTSDKPYTLQYEIILASV